MKRRLLILASVVVVAGVLWSRLPARRYNSLRELRAQFTTRIVRDVPNRDAERTPPGSAKPVFDLVKYPSPAGPLWAYVTPAPATPAKLPAVVWAVGGFSGGIDASLAEPGPPLNDQTAAAFREAGLVLMLPSLRGGNDNPGKYEELMGEVDDFIAAARFAATLPYVDANRVYLGGHSTGGTLVLLAAEMTDAFRAAFAFGPVSAPELYGAEYAPFDPTGPDAALEWLARSPGPFLRDIKTPTFVLEGAAGNVAAADILAAMKNPNVHVHVTTWGDHFSVLQPLTRRLAVKILKDTGATCGIQLTDADLRPPE